MNESITQQSAALHPYLDNLQRYALVVGLVGLAATVVGYFTAEEQFFRSYLLAFTFWIGLPLGSLGILMIHHVGGGTWGFSIRRLLEAGTRTLPLLFVLSLPILFLGLHDLYEWTHQNVVQKDSILQQKVPFLNEPFFIVRTVLYFAIWGLFAFLLNRWSLQQDQTTETHPTHRMQVLSGPGIVIFFLTATLASVDWLMSLEPHWFSTIFGIIYIVGMALMTWGFMYLIAVPLSRREPLQGVITEQHLRDLGTFMLACVMLWAYTSFSQLLIIWSANLPEEITWYITRLEGGWQYVGYGLLVFHFAVPFLFLISSTMKSKTVHAEKGAELPQHRDHHPLARPSHSNRPRRPRHCTVLRATEKAHLNRAKRPPLCRPLQRRKQSWLNKHTTKPTPATRRPMRG